MWVIRNEIPKLNHILMMKFVVKTAVDLALQFLWNRPVCTNDAFWAKQTRFRPSQVGAPGSRILHWCNAAIKWNKAVRRVDSYVLPGGIIPYVKGTFKIQRHWCTHPHTFVVRGLSSTERRQLGWGRHVLVCPSWWEKQPLSGLGQLLCVHINVSIYLNENRRS